MTKRSAIDELITSKEFRQLQEIGQHLETERSQFDLLSLYDDFIVENTWSRLFAFLLDSRNNPDWETSFLSIWIKIVVPQDHRIFSLTTSKSLTSKAITEWVTTNNRRIDILIRITDDNNKLIAVIGIENKVDAGEQKNQLSDYQKALIDTFPNIPKLVIFITPDGRLSNTDMDSIECPVVWTSYQSISTACEKSMTNSQNNNTTYLSVLKTHIDKSFNINTMEAEIKKYVLKIYEDPKYREAIKLINEYSPNINSVFDRLQESLDDKNPFEVLPKNYQGIEVSPYRTSEFKVYFDILSDLTSRKGIWPCIMLHHYKENPAIGDEFVFRVALNCTDFLQGKDKTARVRLKSKLLSIAELPGCRDEKFRWGRWVNIWVGDSYKLVDLGSKDVDGMRDLLIRNFSEIYKPLKQKLKLLSDTVLK